MHSTRIVSARDTFSDNFNESVSYEREGLMGLEFKHVKIVKDEDIDWTVYHLIVRERGCAEDMVIEGTGYEKQIIISSLDRLRRFCLVECRNDTWCACNTEEIIMKKQIQELLSDGFELSGGVIKYRPVSEGK